MPSAALWKGPIADLELRYAPVAVVDLARMDVWVRQVLVDVGAGDRDGVAGDVAALGVVRDRVAGGLDPGAGRPEAGRGDLRVAAGKADVGGVVDAAVRLRAVLAGMALKARVVPRGCAGDVVA
jgi:hypothetical protein